MKKVTSIMMVVIFLAVSFLVAPLVVTKAATQVQITRGEADARALSMINLTWVYSKTTNSAINPKYAYAVTSPKQFINVTTAQAVGIPYNWGGLDGLDSNSYNAPWTSFTDAINKGAYAGNINSSGGIGYVPGTAGLDCSGFVQAVFNIRDYKQSTSSLLTNYFTKINLSDLKHMDILDKPGDHAVIFDKWGSVNGLSGAFTYECTPDQYYGGIQGAKKYFISMNTINSGYIPGRYVYIAPDLPHPVDPGIFAQISNANIGASFMPSTLSTGTVLGTIPNGSIIYLIDYNAGWYQVSYNGKIGWIYGDYISAIPSGKYVTVANATALNIRSGPSTTNSILGVLTTSQYATVLGYSADGKWCNISYNGIQGWSSKAYLSYIY